MVAKNQTIIFGQTSQNKSLNNEAEIIEFLKKSQHFKHIENIEKLAEGGEAIIYKINYIGFDEVVLKVPKTKF